MSGLLISEMEAERKLTHKDNLLVKHGVVGTGNHNNGTHGVGRPKGGTAISPEVKALLGTIAMEAGVTETARAFGKSISAVSNYKNGNKFDGKPDEEQRKVLDSNINKIREKVVNRILSHIDAISEEKVSEASLPILSKSASNLASIYDKFRESSGTGGNVQQQFVFFGVKPRIETEYNVIEVEASVE